jgi:type IV secretory pathway TrbF-like protein
VCVGGSSEVYVTIGHTHVSSASIIYDADVRSLAHSLTTHISRVHALLIDHFLKHQGLLCMYNNISFVQEVFDFIYAC